MTHRRQGFKLARTLPSMLLLPAVITAFAASGPPGSRAGPKYMLLDDRNVFRDPSIEHPAELVLGAVFKHAGNPLIREDRDYEMRFDNMQPTVWYDPQLQKWRTWYSTFTNCSKPKTEIPMCNNEPQECGSVSPPTPYGKAGRGEGFLYAESDDGIVWTKPDLNMTEWKGSKANNLIELGGMTTQVYLDERAANASERYKIVTGNNGLGAIAVSADGISWANAKNLQADTHGRWDTPKNLVWDPDRRQWIIYLRSAPTFGQPGADDGTLRVQSYTHSLTEDFMGEWSTTMPTGLNSSAGYQPDGLLVFPYEGIFIGIGNVFNPSQDAVPVPIGQVNMVLAWSADGRHWNWIRPTESFVPLGTEAGAFDSCGVFSAKQDPLRMAAAADDGSPLRLYYTGCNGPFFGSRGCAMGLATVQRDGFAGFRGGTVVTVPVAVAGDSVTLSLDGGSTSGVRVGVVGDPNRTVATSMPITGKHTDVLVTWEGLGSDLRMLYGAVQLQIEIPTDATVFAFAFWDSPAPRPTGVKLAMTASTGAEPANTEFGGGDFTKAWDSDTATFYDFTKADGGFTEATTASRADRSISCLRFFPRAQYIAGRYEGGTFIGFTSAGKAVPLATITETPSLSWQLLNVSDSSSPAEKVVRVRYNSPDGGFGNMAEIEVYAHEE
jgi:hypothetical protein